MKPHGTQPRGRPPGSKASPSTRQPAGRPATAGQPASAAQPTAARGRLLIRIDQVGTALFVVTSATAVVSDSPVRIVAVALALVMFAAGSLAYLVGYGMAVQRSRTVEISMAGLVLLKESVPQPVRRTLWAATLVQVVTALVAASVRPFSTLAFGILAPMFGMGIQAWWAAMNGTFPPRPRPAAATRRRSGEPAAQPRRPQTGEPKSKAAKPATPTKEANGDLPD